LDPSVLSKNRQWRPGLLISKFQMFEDLLRINTMIMGSYGNFRFPFKKARAKKSDGEVKE
jgi:hypothetical protein